MHVIGDARGRMNSLYAWGVSMALQQAAALTDAIREHPTDLAAQAWALEAAVADEIEDRYRMSLADDRAWLRALGDDRPQVTNRRTRLINEVLRPASKVDGRGMARAHTLEHVPAVDSIAGRRRAADPPRASRACRRPAARQGGQEYAGSRRRPRHDQPVTNRTRA
jgi:flavin-dependent dehydrogenase